MRIRKRKVPLPLSLLSPVPLTDPHLFSRSPVMLHHLDHSPGLTSSSPAPDLLSSLIIDNGFTSKHSGFGVAEREQQQQQQQRNNDSSNTAGVSATICSAPASSQNHDNVPLLSLSNEDLKERVIPLKKRKTSLEQAICTTTANNASTTMLAVDKACSSKDDDNLPVPSETNSNNNCSSNSSANANGSVGKKGAGGKRGNTIMEGSRCSRVNGRGWRCCQPTLVGYSLCEHHLGKGRMRSMTTVRGRPLASKKAPPPPPPPPPKKSSEVIHQDEVIKPMSTAVSSIGKRVKLGVVKARSLSSLLGQTTNVTSNIDHIGVAVNNIHQQASISLEDENHGSIVKENAY